MNNQDLIGYDDIIEGSMRLVIHEALKKVEKDGLRGNHYFVITFATKAPGVSIAKSLMEKYPEEMTIIVQHQFKALKVEAKQFSISLSFGGKYEKLTIPYKSITSFSDPSMNFALKFSMTFEDLEGLENGEDTVSNQGKKSANQVKSDNPIDLSAKVVSLDAFRKNKDNNNNT